MKNKCLKCNGTIKVYCIEDADLIACDSCGVVENSFIVGCRNNIT